MHSPTSNPLSVWNRKLDYQPSVFKVYLLLVTAVIVGGFACYIVGLFLLSEGSQLVAAYASGVALMLIGFLGTLLHGARRSIPARILTIFFLVLFQASFALLLMFAAQLKGENADSLQTEQFILAGGITVALLSAACFMPMVRHWSSRVLPINPNDFTHAYVLAIGVTTIGWAMLSLLPFQQPLLYGLMADGINSSDVLNSPLMTNTSLVSMTIWSLPAAVLAAGFGVTRNLRQALTRLGFRHTPIPIVGVGIASAVLLVIAGLILNPLIQWIWTHLGWPVTDLQQFAELSNLPVDPLGILIVGVSAGVSEEILVRGLLQPRLGIVAANALFAIGHSFQYEADGLLVVMGLGLVFGYMRQRWGLVPAIISHALYDILLLGLAVLIPDLIY